MNPTLAAALATLPSHIEWLPGDEANTAEADIILNDIVLCLDIAISPARRYSLAANITGHDRPRVRVLVGDRADLRAAWTEVAAVVSRVDAAAGAAMVGLPRDLSARINATLDKPTSAEVVAELEALLVEAEAAAPPPDADLSVRASWLAALAVEEARDALAYHRGLLACVDPSSFGSDP